MSIFVSFFLWQQEMLDRVGYLFGISLNLTFYAVFFFYEHARSKCMPRLKIPDEEKKANFHYLALCVYQLMETGRRDGGHIYVRCVCEI